MNGTKSRKALHIGSNGGFYTVETVFIFTGLSSQVKETLKVPLAQIKPSDQEESIDLRKQDSFEFDDACSWSDDSHVSLNDTTLVNHTSPDTSIIISSDEEERRAIQPVKRVISKKKVKSCDELESSIGNVSNENATEQVGKWF